VHLALLAAAFALDVGLARRAAARAAPPPRRAPGIAWPRGWA